MPYQNRVTPFGDLEISSARGLLMGNRGILHDEHGVIGAARWRHKSWIACTLSFKSRKARINAPGHYTQLFFCDEATALAAGHRPCAECRHLDYLRFLTAWQKAYSLRKLPRAKEIDAVLHSARVTPRKIQPRSRALVGGMPNGTFINLPDRPNQAWLVWDDNLYLWSQEGYYDRCKIQTDKEVGVLTPEPTVRVLAAGYRPIIHPSLGKSFDQEHLSCGLRHIAPERQE